MESTINQKGDIAFELDITLTPDEFGTFEHNVYRKAQKQVVLKGYRKGHVPIPIIKKLHGKALEEEVMDAAIHETFQSEVIDKGIRPVGRPLVTHVHKTDAGGLHCTIAYEIFPDIDLKDYKGLPAKRIVHQVTEKELDEEMARAAERFGAVIDAQTIADEYHGVTIDMQKLADGEPVIGDVQRDVRVYLRSETINPDLKGALIGKNVGDSFKLDLQTGEDGSTSTFDITVKSASQIVPAELNDELARTVLNKEDATLDQLRDAIRQGLMAEYDKQFTGLFRDELIHGLIDRNPIAVPSVIVNEVLDQYLDEYRKGEEKELPKDFDMKGFLETMKPRAEVFSKWALLREALAAKEDLQATDDDYEGLASLESERTGIEFDRILRYMKKTSAYADRIRAEKALQFLEDYAIVQEVDDRQIKGLNSDVGSAPEMPTVPEPVEETAGGDETPGEASVG